MPWRGIFVVTIGLLTSGCLLSAYQIASWTMTGVSYVFSGKGVGDHALSLATSKDCAALRILQAKQVCIDYSAEFESAWSAMASSWEVPDVLGDPVTVADAGGLPVVLTAYSVDAEELLKPASDSTAVQAAAMTVQPNASSRDEEAARSGLDFDGLVARQQRVEAEDVESPWLASAAVEPTLDFGGLTPSVYVVENVSEKKIAASTSVMRIANSLAVVTAGRPAIYLVLGSFRNRANADALRARHADKKMLVKKIPADDRAMFRVLAGPIAAAVLTKARVDIAKAGIRNAWAVRLCSGSLAPPPCEPVQQQASLPEG